MTNRETPMTLRRFFSGLTEYTFQSRLGVVDPPLVDYISDLLSRFVRNDSIYRIRNLTGRPVAEVGEMLAEAEARLGDARRQVHRHIGDFTLFWAGIYPECLRRLRGLVEMDRYNDYCAHGKRSYRIASSIDTEQVEETPGDVLERLSDQFELCAYGLREIRREWERRDDDEVRSLLIN